MWSIVGEVGTDMVQTMQPQSKHGNLQTLVSTCASEKQHNKN